MMHCSNIARAPALPLLSRVSIRPKCIKFTSALINGNGLDLSPLCIAFHHKTLANSSTTLSKPKIFFTGARVFSTGSLHRAQESDEGESGRKSLPWIASYKEREGRRGEKRAAVKTSPSAWGESAERYFSRKERTLEREPGEKQFASRGRNRESRENRRDLHEEESLEDERDAEPINDPRWDKVRSRYKGSVDRDTKFERPDVQHWSKGSVDRDTRFERPEVQHWSKQENWGRKTWKEATESSLPKIVGQGVYGVGPVLAALTVQRREFYALYVQEGLDLSGNNRKKKDKKGVEKILKLAETIGLKVMYTSKHDLNMMADNRPHQGLVLDASTLEMVKIRELDPVSIEGQRAPVWLALDEVMDPQNLGAIVRSAYFFGVEGVVLCAKNSAPLSGVVSKASAGSLELIELRSCKNMMQFLSSSIENGWRVLGGSVCAKAQPLSEIKAGVPSILVLGSEGSGLRPLVEKSCTQLIRIPGNALIDGGEGVNEPEAEEMKQTRSGQELKSFLAVESLNVSVAAGVLLYHLVRNNSHLGAEQSSTVVQ